MATFRSLNDWIAHNRYFIPLLALFIPLTVRIIPEVLVGSYIIGFDTLAFYVPNSLQWLHGGLNLWSFLSVAPLFYSFLMLFVANALPIVLALKILSPLLLGFLGLSIYFYAHKGLGWSSIKSLMPALLGTLYFVSLRISWDMLRNELGLIFLFIVLTLFTLKKGNLWQRFILLSLAMMAVVLSHQLASVITFGISLFTIVYYLFQGDKGRSLFLTIATLPAVLFFLIFYFGGVAPVGFQNNATVGVSPLANWLGFPSYQSMLLSELGFFLYCFILILPFALLGIKRFGNFQLRSWLILTLILVLIPFAFVSPFRWLLLLVYPLVFYVTESITLLKSHKWKRFKLSVFRIALLYITISTAILSAGFIINSPEQPFIYFNPIYLNSFQYQIPTSMQQNTISIADFQGTANVLQWFKDSENGSSILLTHTVFYGWASLTIDDHQIRPYGFDDPTHAAMIAKQEGNNVFLIWWRSGEGWYAESSLPSVFQEVYHSGRMAIYQYSAI